MRFKWNENPNTATSYQRPDSGKGAMGFNEESDGVGLWSTEYDTQCLLSMALSGDDDAMGPVAGLVYEKPAAAPVMFSWGRDKAKKKKHDNIDSAEADAPAPEVSTQAPFDTSVPHQGSWKSETTANYNDEALHGDKEGTAAIPSKSSTDAPLAPAQVLRATGRARLSLSIPKKP